MKHPCLGWNCRKYLQCLQFSSLFWSLHEVALFSENNSNTCSIIRQSTMPHLKTTAVDDRMTIANIVRNKKFQNSNLETNEVKEKLTRLWNWLQLWIWRLVRRRKISIPADWYILCLRKAIQMSQNFTNFINPIFLCIECFPPWWIFRKRYLESTSCSIYNPTSHNRTLETNTQGRPQTAWKGNWCRKGPTRKHTSKSQEKRI